jgi:hypothetical protein
MTTNAVASQGTTLAISTNTTDATNFTTVTEIESLSGVDKTTAEYRVTDLSSTAHEYKQGLDDSGSLAFTCFYKGTDDEHILLRDRVGSGTSDIYKVTLADSSNYMFNAEVQRFNRTFDVDGPVRAEVSLRVSGDTTEASS